MKLTKSSSPYLSTYTIHTSAVPSPLLDVLILALVGALFSAGGSWRWSSVGLGTLCIYFKMGVVLTETILSIRGLGLQLSTTRGFQLSLPFTSVTIEVPMSTAKTFVPLNSIQDVVINEGIYGWRIVYYIVVIQDGGEEEGVKLRVAFPELLPRLDELRQVWRGVRETLFDELGEGEDGNEG